jgi:hypothetical protein
MHLLSTKSKIKQKVYLKQFLQVQGLSKTSCAIYLRSLLDLIKEQRFKNLTSKEIK